MPYENYDLSDHPGIGSAQADVYAAFLFSKAGYPSPPAEIYESVFYGETEVTTLEEIYRIFNRKDEADTRYLEKIGFTGHSMSVSDIVEVQDSSGESRFYFCDTFGFPQISFQKERTMLPVQNHDYISYEQVSRSKSGYLAYMDTAEFLFIPVSRFSSSAANTVSANSATGSVTGRRKGYLLGRENFWNVQLSFCLRTR